MESNVKQRVLELFKQFSCNPTKLSKSEFASKYGAKQTTLNGQLGVFILYVLYQFVSCVSCTGSSSSYTHDETDTSYWNSVNRENQLRESGNEGAANMEENARHEYNHGGGYHDQNGNRQVGFKGSREQKQQLEEMDRRGW